MVLILASAGCAPKRSGILAALPAPVFATGGGPHRSAPHHPGPALVPQPDRSPTAVPNGWLPSGGCSGRWEYIVLHHSGGLRGGARVFHEYHTRVRRWDELGYHFVIGNGSDTPDGLVEVGPRWSKQKHGAHCKTPGNYHNLHGIGICLVGDFERSRPSPAQMASLESLVGFLSAECLIPPTRVVTHGGVTGKTACPGRNFSLVELKSRLASASGAADGFR